jgi:hypothetical protein
MSGFKEVDSYAFLSGLELTQIGVGSSDVTFVFVEGPRIRVTGGFEHLAVGAAKPARYQIDGATKLFTAQRLLGLKTTRVDVVSDGALRIVFQNGDTLTLLRGRDSSAAVAVDRGPMGAVVNW